MKYNTLLQKFIFPIAELVNGTSIQKKMKFLEKSQYWSRKKIEDYQNKRLKELIKHAYDNVPYYKKLFDKLNIKISDIKTKKDLKKIPLLTKQLIKENFEDLKASNLLEKSYPTYTSGSSGTPMVFFQTKEDFSWIWAAEFRSWMKAGYKLGDKYTKLSLNPRNRTSKKIQDFIMRCHYIYSSKISNKDVKKEIENIIKSKSKFIYGYTSTISVIAKYMNEHDISIKMDGVFTFGDQMTSQYRKVIQKVFQTKVYDSYGCGGEGLNIAFECEKGKYHINDELLIIESDNKNAVITSLNNYAMPLIRYTPNDLISLGKKCSCGRNLSILKNLEGRSTDMIICPNGNKLVVHFFTTFFEHLKGIEQFKVIQIDKRILNIQLVVTKNIDKIEVERKISEYIKKYGGDELKIKYRYLDDIPLEKNGKRKIIDNRIK